MSGMAVLSVVGLVVVLVLMTVFLLLRQLLGGGAWCVYAPRLDGKVALVTGSTSGIGFSVATALARLGATVVLANRSIERNRLAAAAIQAAAPAARVECLTLDLSDLRSVEACAEAFQQRHSVLNILVCNAAAMGAQKPQTAQGLEWHFGVNAFGHFRLVQRLLPALERGAAAETSDGGGSSSSSSNNGNGHRHSRVIFTASLAHRTVSNVDLDAVLLPTPSDPQQSFRCYGMSKLAAVFYVAELQRQVGARGVLAMCADPGVARTRITEHSFPSWVHGLWNILPLAANPDEAAQTVLHCALAPQASLIPAGYYYNCRAVRPSKAALNGASARRLWDWCFAHESL